ncbi:hypothetical protein AC93_5005 [Escherichia coli 2-005-03_S4_C2]|nr:hypothetical protein AC93_5005 [Escherichia coli 2-005-03_S4_C2]
MCIQKSIELFNDIRGEAHTLYFVFHDYSLFQAFCILG